jgi:hypothetical protein
MSRDVQVGMLYVGLFVIAAALLAVLTISCREHRKSPAVTRGKS